MKLYDMQMAPNPRRVRVFLAEKGIDNVELVPVDISKREHKSDGYMAGVNRMGQVPTLELDDGSHISESMAICRYFEEIQPDPPLFGRDAKEKAEVEMWSRRAELNIMTCVAAGFRHTSDFFKGLEDQVPAWGELNKGKAPERFTWLDGVLADREFVAGANYSVADITALIAVDFARVVGLKVTDEWPNLARWHGAMSARPSAKA
ncbi:MAG: glutathione S-transferase family protein [Alphaproteobacteria bacterium]|nr:glutathione S-transferase family protein [Alphaproteobacteria bacterium]